MVRANKKQRGKYTRKRKSIILIATEGKNKTEKTYFREFNESIKPFNIIFADGNNTDPVKIVNDAILTAHNKGIEVDNGDYIFAVFDTDFNKIDQIIEARKLASKNGVSIILSNPCFEVWLLLHFRYSTRGYNSNAEVLNELCNRWSGYQKNITTYQNLQDRCDVAVKNAERLKRFHIDTNGCNQIEYCNPSTDVYEIVAKLIKLEEAATLMK